MKKHLFSLILMLLCGYQSHLIAVVKGSTTTISIEPYVIFPAADDDNAMQGFGWFKNGFALEDNTTSCDFASVYPVSGLINLNGGRLNLLEDLILKNFTTLQGLGTISGNNYSLEFCSSITALPENADTFENVYLSLSNTIQLNGDTTFAGFTVLDGRGHTLELGSRGAIIVAGSSTLQLKDMIIKGIAQENIRCIDDTATLVLDNVKWVESDDVIFGHGALRIEDKAEFYGNYVFAHTSMLPITIEKQSMWSIHASIDLELGKQLNLGAANPLEFEDSTSIWKLSNCSLLITGGGLQLTKGKLILDEEVEIDMQSTNTTNGLIFGDGVSPENDFSVRFNSGVSVTHAGHTVYNNTSPDKLDSLSKNAKIIRESNSNIFMAKNITLPSMTLESVSNNVPPIQSAAGVRITYQDDQVLLPSVAFDITGRQEESNTFLLTGSHELFFTKGSLPLNLSVSGINNLIHGNGGIAGLLTLENNTTELKCCVQGPISYSPILNGGKITLGGDFVLGPDTTFAGLAVIDLASCALRCGAKDVVWTGSTVWQGSDGSIDMRAKITLVGAWKIEGQVTINGNDNTLDLGTQGHIVIAPGATLRCKNVRLNGISEANIRCADDTATLLLEDVVWVQDGDFEFSTGCISIKDEVDFLGSYTFSYTSKKTSTIQQKSEWHITDDMRFEIGKNPAGDAWPLSFVDHTSALHLDNCNYVITGSGMQIIKGTIMYSRDVAIEIQSTDTTNGSFLGNGVAVDDPVVQFNPGSAARFLNGHMVWDVVDTTKLRSDSTSVNIVRSGGNTYYIKQNLILKRFTVNSDESVVTKFAPGKNLSYDQCLFTLPNGQIAITGSRYNDYASLLGGNGSIFLHYGTLPLVTYVLGTGNRIEGNGSITGPIVLLAPSAVLNCNLGGSLEGNLMLNGGTVNLEGGLMLVDDAVIATDGSMNLGSYPLDFPAKDTVWTSNILWSGNHANLNLNGKTSLAGQWVFTGDYTINGNGNMLDLSPGGTLEIAAGVTLKLVNLRVRGVSGTNIRCADDTSKLVLDQVVWVQDGDFNFADGSITFKNSVDFLGTHTFTYSSKKSSRVNEKSKWHIANSMRFEIGKQPQEGAENPLLFTDNTSILHLDNCTFVVTDLGWDLLKGCIQYSRDVSIEVLSTSTLNGVSMGDGTPENDPLVLFDPGSNARFKKGHLSYNIVDQGKLRSDSSTVKMIRLADSYFNIKQNITLKNFEVDASALAVTEVDPGKVFRYENCIFILPDGHAEVSAYRYNPVANVLINNDVIFMRYGSMPMATLVQGVGNKIAGTGDITGPILLMGPQAHLACDLSGSLAADVTLNGGTFALDRDLQLRDSAQFIGMGFVDLRSSQLSLGSKDTVWASTIFWSAQDASIQMNAKVSLQGNWNVNGNCTIDGNGNVFDFGKIGKILIADGVTITLRNMRLTGIIDGSFEFLGDASSLVLDNVAWVQDGNFTLDRGSLLFKNTVDFNGAYTFALDTLSTSTIAVNSVWSIGNAMQLSLGKKTRDSADPVYFEDSSSTLCLNNCIFDVTKQGLGFTRGHVICNGDVSVDIHSTSTANGLRLGDGTPAGNMVFEFNPGSNVSFLTGHAVYDVTVPDSVLSRSTVAKLTRAAGSNFYVNQDIILKNLTVDASLYAVTDVAQGKSFGYKNCTLNLPTGSIVANAVRYNAYTNLLAGNESIFLAGGANPMYTVVSGTGNYIIGNGSLTGQTILLGPDAQLILSVDGLITQDIMLNGGTVTLGQDLKFATNTHFIGDGVIALAGNQVTFGPHPSDWTGNLIWEGDGGQIDFNADVAISKSWVFSGDMCVLHGHGNTLELSNAGEIIVGDNATLYIKDAQIKGIAGSNIRCLSSTSKLILENVTWIQEDDYQFATGSIEWRHENEMCGHSAFVYQTLETSTIAQRACLCLDAHFTFRYDPLVTGTVSVPQNLIAFEDETAVLALKGATLYAVHGIELTKGSLVIQKNSSCMSSTIEQGITVGTGTAVDDCKIHLHGGVQLTISQGALNYKNSDFSSWSSGNNLSTLCLADTVILNLYQSLDVGVGGFLFGQNTSLNRATGMDIFGSLTAQGELSFGSL